MSKRKKKPNLLRIQKTENAHQRNEFIAHLKHFCDTVSNPNIFKLIPQHEIEGLYNARCHSVRFVAAAGQKVSGALLKEIKHVATYSLKNKLLQLGVGRVNEICLHDYFTFGLTLILYAHRLDENAYPNAPEVKKALAPLAAIAESELYNKAWNEFLGTMNTMGIMHSDLTGNLYALKFQSKIIADGLSGMFSVMEVNPMQTEVIQVKIDGHNRPAYRVAAAVPEPTPHLAFITLQSQQLNLLPGLTLDVYIQAHALNRLTERLDGVPLSVLHFNTFDSLSNLKICKNKKDDLLIEYRIFNNKTGYFKADVIDGRLLLRTFLFLTNNGTPEGEKLHADTGIVKEDKIYLTIDKLSTFIHSDIANNEKIKEMFIKAGCKSLLEIDKNVKFPMEYMQQKSIAPLISKYLKLDSNTK